ncbi:MAG: tRNA dihydrouridine synthase DusB [Ignavibacteria bacterium]|nr:tRNA dihydrouridine synthase DusB [Ignavibacteria bacterium]
MFSIAGYNIEKGVFLAPMEDISDISFRLVCKELGAGFVYTEFVNSEGLVRGSEKTHKKMEILDDERPVGIQIYGGNPDSMVGAARFAEKLNPDIIDINAGCWVKNVVGSGAGAALMKDPEALQNMVASVVKNVQLPVTVKTRIGWDQNTINILEVAKRLEDVGVQALTVHCRTRSQGHTGIPDWSWIEKIKNVVTIPIVLNGGIMTAQDVNAAFSQTPADAVMVARGAIGNPWIFAESRKILNGEPPIEITPEFKISTCLRHLKLATGVKGERRAVIEHRKFYTGYLKFLRNASQVRAKIMTVYTFSEVEEILQTYLNYLQSCSEDEINKTLELI